MAHYDSRINRLLARCFLPAAFAILICASIQAEPVPAQHAKVPAHVVTDETGRRVAVPIDVRRIVSLAPNLTETVYALGLEDHLVGDTIYCDYPREARSKPHVGATLNPSLEAILALKPDLVLATTAINRQETVTALERLGIAVYATDPHTIEQLLAGIQHLAELIGAGPKGTALVTDLHLQLSALHYKLAQTQAVRVLFVVWEDPLISIGQNTFIADALRWAGANSVVNTKQNWPKIGFEEVVRLQPEYLILAADQNNSAATILAELRQRPGFRNLESVKEGRVAVIGDSIDRPAPRLIAAIEQLARTLHPQAFASGAASLDAQSAGRPRVAEISSCFTGALPCSR
jgi:iron complex transport system substrate-binding protein